jgi:hypothetical protein
MEYRDLLVDIVHQRGKGVRYSRVGERAPTRIGTEYLMPGTMTEWSIPNKRLETKVLRELRYSASMRRVGEQAGRLLVLESDSVRIQPETFGTLRRLYRFTWDEGEVVESEVLPIEIISSARADAEVLPIEPFGIREALSLDHEHTAAQTINEGGEYSRFVNPFSEFDSPWAPVSHVDFDGLLYRTDAFGKEIVAEIAERLRRERVV